MEQVNEKNSTKFKHYTLGEEIMSAVTHGIGGLLSIAGLVIAIVIAATQGDAYAVVSAVIFGVSLIIMYTMSTLYHSITNEKAKRVFKILDHCAIFLVIAGSYTPYTLVTLRGSLGWTIFGIIWTLAVMAITFNAISIDKFKKVNLVVCLLMGWIIVFAMKPLIAALPVNGVILLAAGGLAYTIGVIFYALKRLKYMHSIWHLFVMAGSILQYFSVILYVLPIQK